MDHMERRKAQIALIVAHPDDETLWAGGTVLISSFHFCFILSLCRGTDRDRAPRFYKAINELGATGRITDLDDGPEQLLLNEALIAETILNNLPSRHFNRIYTHNPLGEYTRHIRHEETGRVVLKLWLSGELQADEILLFAYEDGGKAYLPEPMEKAHIKMKLPEDIWNRKYCIITDIYNFNKESFEARTTPKVEAFWQIKTYDEAKLWLKKERKS